MTVIDNTQRIVTARGTKAAVEALTASLEEVVLAYATDTTQLGVYTAGGWVWLGAGTTSSDTNIWRPVVDGAGAVILDGSGQALMSFGPA